MIVVRGHRTEAAREDDLIACRVNHDRDVGIGVVAGRAEVARCEDRDVRVVRIRLDDVRLLLRRVGRGVVTVKVEGHVDDVEAVVGHTGVREELSDRVAVREIVLRRLRGAGDDRCGDRRLAALAAARFGVVELEALVRGAIGSLP